MGQAGVRLLVLAEQAPAGGLPAAAVLASGPGGLFLATLGASSWQLKGCHRIAEAPAEQGAQLRAALAAGAGGEGGAAALVWEVGAQAVRLDLATGERAPAGCAPALLVRAAVLGLSAGCGLPEERAT